MSLHHPDHKPYKGFTKRQRVDKAVHTLTGLLRGIAIDDELNALEVAELLNWCEEHKELVGRAPFNELIPHLKLMMQDGVVDPEELEDLLWLCKNLSPESDYYDEITNEIQVLQGMLHGIMADDHVSLTEAKELQKWVDEHSHLKGSYPYDELDSLLLAVLADGMIDDEEQQTLKAFFEDFIQYSFSKRVKDETARIKSGLSLERSLPAICAACPEIEFESKAFTFTGTSMKGQRTELVDRVKSLGGSFSGNLTQKTDFLVVGARGNPCWAFSCYGRKVEKATEYRKKGQQIVIVHESDFWDAVEDNQ